MKECFFLWAYLLRARQSCFSSRQRINQRLDRLLNNSLLHSGFSLEILEDAQSALRETLASVIVSETGYSLTSAHYSRHRVQQLGLSWKRNIKKRLHRQKLSKTVTFTIPPSQILAASAKYLEGATSVGGKSRLTESITLQMLQQILNVTWGSIFGEKNKRWKRGIYRHCGINPWTCYRGWCCYN